MPVAMLFLFRAMAQQRDPLLPGQVLEQSQGKLLAVVLDPFVSCIKAARFKQLLHVTPAVVRPRNPSRQNGVAQFLARAKVRHPDVKTIRRQSSSPSPGRQNPQPVAWPDSAMDRFGLEHG